MLTSCRLSWGQGQGWGATAGAFTHSSSPGWGRGREGCAVWQPHTVLFNPHHLHPLAIWGDIFGIQRQPHHIPTPLPAGARLSYSAQVCPAITLGTRAHSSGGCGHGHTALEVGDTGTQLCSLGTWAYSPGGWGYGHTALEAGDTSLPAPRHSLVMFPATATQPGGPQPHPCLPAQGAVLHLWSIGSLR